MDKNDELTKKYAREMLSKVSKLDYRIHDKIAEGRPRNEYSRDYARILYSSSFRRLQGKMQMLGIHHTHFFRNRLTHSLEVAQIARAVANDLQIDTTYVAEACSLAHDLGNPPFGHSGEQVLNNIAKSFGGFEGNAQTLRILLTLEKKHHDYRGLNLTFRTLLGVVKYYKKFELDISGEPVTKKFIYHEDYDLISEQLAENGLTNDNDAKSIDMQIMDLADRIAYGAHDLEDCLSMGLFSIDELLHEFYINDCYKEAYEDIQSIVGKCREFAMKGKLFDSSEEFSFLFRKELTSEIVNTLIKDIKFCNDRQSLVFGNYEKLADGLKKLVFKIVMRRPSVQLYEKHGAKIIQSLYEVYMDDTFNHGLKLLPSEYRVYKDEQEKARNVVDFIAGMMDQFAIQEYKCYFGEKSLDRLFNVNP